MSGHGDGDVDVVGVSHGDVVVGLALGLDLNISSVIVVGDLDVLDGAGKIAVDHVDVTVGDVSDDGVGGRRRRRGR